MTTIALKPKDEQQYLDLKRIISRIVDAHGSCEMTTTAFHFGCAIKSVEMGATEMAEHIGAVLSGSPRRVLPDGPRTVDEFLQQMAREMGCELSRPMERPWNVLFRRAE